MILKEFMNFSMDQASWTKRIGTLWPYSAEFRRTHKMIDKLRILNISLKIQGIITKSKNQLKKSIFGKNRDFFSNNCPRNPFFFETSAPNTCRQPERQPILMQISAFRGIVVKVWVESRESLG